MESLTGIISTYSQDNEEADHAQEREELELEQHGVQRERYGEREHDLEVRKPGYEETAGVPPHPVPERCKKKKGMGPKQMRG